MHPLPCEDPWLEQRCEVPAMKKVFFRARSVSGLAFAQLDEHGRPRRWRHLREVQRVAILGTRLSVRRDRRQ